jgi:exopolysaccharide production protein ExoQ
MNSSTSIHALAIDRANCAGIAAAAGFFFGFRSVLVLFIVRVLGADPRVGSEASLALEGILLALVCFCSVGVGRRLFRSIYSASPTRWVAAYLAVALCSLVWSATVSLPTSVAYWCGLACDVLIVVLLLRVDSIHVSQAMIKGFVWSAVCIALLAWLMPAQSDLRLGDQDFLNANQIANLCAFAIFLAQYLMAARREAWGLAIGFLAITLVRSLSKTTIIAFVLSEGFLVLRDKSMSRRTKIRLAIAVVALMCVFWGLFQAYYSVYTNAGNQAETLTGRTAIWAYVADATTEHPWIGHGFDSMWKVIPPFGSDRFEARHAENELLQQFYSYGVLGLCLLAGIYGSLLRQIRRSQQGPARVVFLCMLLYVVLRGVTEAEPFDLLFPLWMIVLVGALAMDAKAAVAAPERGPRWLAAELSPNCHF